MAFFEQIGKRLNNAGRNVAQQTKDLADVTKLNSAITDRNKKISQMFCVIGQSYYERHKNDDCAEEIEKITEINQLYTEIYDYQEKIKHIKGLVKCENCGAEIPAEALFCNMCGANVRHEIPTENSGESVVCPVCHAVAEPGNLFCNHCGTKLENTDK